MAVRLASPAVVTRVEEGEQTPLLAILRPRLQTRVRRLQIILLQHVCLLLVCLSREDEVACDDGELVEDEEVRWRRGGDVDDVQVWRRVVEGIEVFFGRALHVSGLWDAAAVCVLSMGDTCWKAGGGADDGELGGREQKAR